jgi:hypothetical protein
LNCHGRPLSSISSGAAVLRTSELSIDLTLARFPSDEGGRLGSSLGRMPKHCQAKSGYDVVAARIQPAGNRIRLCDGMCWICVFAIRPFRQRPFD